MKYCVDIKENKTGSTIKTILKTDSHDEVYKAISEYNEGSGDYANLLKQYPKNQYFIGLSLLN